MSIKAQANATLHLLACHGGANTWRRRTGKWSATSSSSTFNGFWSPRSRRFYIRGVFGLENQGKKEKRL